MAVINAHIKRQQLMFKKKHETSPLISKCQKKYIAYSLNLP